MASDEASDTARTAVRTYVPAYQRDEWDEHADELDMSRSEFVRSMVQAGRRGFDEYAEKTTNTDNDQESQAQTRSTEDDLEDLVKETLRDAEYLSWDQLLAAVTDDIESRLDSALQRLQDRNEVTYSGRNGGYTLDE